MGFVQSKLILGDSDWFTQFRQPKMLLFDFVLNDGGSRQTFLQHCSTPVWIGFVCSTFGAEDLPVCSVLI